MTPAARVQAAIDILDQVIAAARSEGAPADRIIADWARGNRYAGSKDRRAIRELVYSAIRHCGEIPATGRAAMLALAQDDPAIRDCFDGSQYGPQALSENEAIAAASVAPQWLVEALAQSGVDREEQHALLGRASLDLRINTLKASAETIDLPEPGEPLVLPQALRFPSGTQIEQWPAYREGRVEVQDLGSQIACLAAAARPGETVLDLCAGAGGKTLALAAAMELRGRLIASDTDLQRGRQLLPRAERAGAAGIETRLLNPNHELEKLSDLVGEVDCVLVDAPCSGTGTWRRKPEAKWRLTPHALDRYAALQDRLLEIAATLVKPGGRLVFVTCSLLDVEGSDRFDAFLARHPQWQADLPALPLGRARGKGWRLTPFQDGTDGFFIARAALPC